MTAGHEKPVSLPSEAKISQYHVTFWWVSLSHTHTAFNAHSLAYFHVRWWEKKKITLDYLHKSTTRGQAAYQFITELRNDSIPNVTKIKWNCRIQNCSMKKTTNVCPIWCLSPISQLNCTTYHKKGHYSVSNCRLQHDSSKGRYSKSQYQY